MGTEQRGGNIQLRSQMKIRRKLRVAIIALASLSVLAVGVVAVMSRSQSVANPTRLSDLQDLVAAVNKAQLPSQQTIAISKFSDYIQALSIQPIVVLFRAGSRVQVPLAQWPSAGGPLDANINFPTIQGPGGGPYQIKVTLLRNEDVVPLLRE